MITYQRYLGEMVGSSQLNRTKSEFGLLVGDIWLFGSGRTDLPCLKLLVSFKDLTYYILSPFMLTICLIGN